LIPQRSARDEQTLVIGYIAIGYAISSIAIKEVLTLNPQLTIVFGRGAVVPQKSGFLNVRVGLVCSQILARRSLLAE